MSLTVGENIMTRTHKSPQPRPHSLNISYKQHWIDIRHPRKIILLVLGTITAGVGIGLIILTELGASPFDAAAVNISGKIGVTVGTSLLIASALLLVFAFLLARMKPFLGTVFSFVGVSVCVDLVIIVGTDFFGESSSLVFKIAGWFVGAGLLGVGAAALISTQLGASPYDQFVQSVTRFGVSIPVARIIVDVFMVIVAFLLGGASIGFGTLGLLIVIPAILKYALPAMRTWLEAGGTPVASLQQK